MFCAYNRTNSDDDNDGYNDNYDDKDGNFDNNDDKNDKNTYNYGRSPRENGIMWERIPKRVNS